MGTLSKAFGLSGGYLAASREVIDLLINRARSFIYTTAPPPHLAHAALAALNVLRGEQGDALRKTLHRNAQALKTALHGLDVSAAILPLILGTEAAAMAASQALNASGFLVPSIRYPTVARGSARLRFTVSAAHDMTQIDALKQALTECRAASFAAPADEPR
jgi:7-keto-8-aminopelargonate synthetase-like enzyme